MGNLIIKPNSGGELKLQDEGGTDSIKIDTSGGVSGSAIIDSDTMSGASATILASSESIKAYADLKLPIANPVFTGKLGLDSAVPSTSTTPNANFQVKGHTQAFLYHNAVPSSTSLLCFKVSFHGFSGAASAGFVSIAGTRTYVGYSVFSFNSMWSVVVPNSGGTVITSLHNYGTNTMTSADLGSTETGFSIPVDTSGHLESIRMAVTVIGHHTFTPEIPVST